MLIACEYSGRVRDAFRERGHDAISCDLLPSEEPGPHCLQPVETLLSWDWDMMIALSAVYLPQYANPTRLSSRGGLEKMPARGRACGSKTCRSWWKRTAFQAMTEQDVAIKLQADRTNSDRLRLAGKRGHGHSQE